MWDMMNWPMIMREDLRHQPVRGSFPSEGWWFDVGENW